MLESPKMTFLAFLFAAFVGAVLTLILDSLIK